MGKVLFLTPIWQYMLEDNLHTKPGQISLNGLLPAYSKNKLYLLFIVPIVYAILSSLYYYQSKAFFSTYPDSTYIYLINGTSMAGGNFIIGHYDNPGTTAHWLACIIIFITHLFTGKGPVNEDVLSNPELYLKVCAFVCIALFVISVFYSGKLILKNTGNIFTALFFQLVPVCTYLAVHHIVRICPEYLMLMILPYYSAYLWVLCYKKNNADEEAANKTKPILFLSFITAALFIAKITCLPFLIVPLFFIKRFIPKIVYLILTASFAMLILFPVWPNLKGMFDWFTGLATHTGIYGSGKEQVVDGEAYKDSLKQIFSTELFFTIGYILVSIGIIAGLLFKKFKNNFYKLSLAFWITMTLQILLAAKHYKFHYLIPAQLLIIPTLLACFSGLLTIKPNKILSFSGWIVCGSFLIFKLGQSSMDYKDGNKIYESSITSQKYAGVPKIITTTYEQSCFVESALHFGAAYGGQHFQSSYEFLRKKYPDTFFYISDRNMIEHFDLLTPFYEVLEKYPKILVYFLQVDENREKEIINTICSENSFGITGVDLVEHNQVTGEKFYMINIDTFLTKSKYSEKAEFVCDFEKRSADKSYFLSTNEAIYFGGGQQASGEQHTSSTTSARSNKTNQYTCWTDFKVKPGDAFSITVNCYYEDVPGNIVLSSSDGKIFSRTSQSVIKDYGNGWKQIGLNARIPLNYPENKVDFSLVYWGAKNCYFDDLKIIHSKK